MWPSDFEEIRPVINGVKWEPGVKIQILEDREKAIVEVKTQDVRFESMPMDKE